MNRKVLMIGTALLFFTVIVAPVMAIGPANAKGKNSYVEIHGFNTQMWLPSGVINEWTENPILPGPTRVTTKDAAKFQIKNAYVIDSPAMVGMVFLMENQWVKLSQQAFATMLAMLMFDPGAAEDYPAGIYIQIRYVGYGVEDTPTSIISSKSFSLFF